MIIVQNNVGKRKHSKRIERRRSFAQAIATDWRLIEDKGKGPIEFPDGRDNGAVATPTILPAIRNEVA